jgi:outer membrane protein assembly factor BamB
LLDTAAAALAPDGTIYFGSSSTSARANSAKLYAYNSATGTKKWEIVVGTGVNANNATAIGPDGTIYIHSDEGRLFAYADNGTSVTTKWSAAIPGNSYTSASVALDGTVYIGCDDTVTNSHRLFALNPPTARRSGPSLQTIPSTPLRRSMRPATSILARSRRRASTP